MASKSHIRKELIKLRDDIPKCIREAKDENIYHKIINSKEYKNAYTIFVFVSYGSEVNTHRIINHALTQGKRVCVPKVISKTVGMKAVEMKAWADLNTNYKGILEPEFKEDTVVAEEEIDLVLAPGVAFDVNGGRIGYGGGFYDRFLRKLGHDCSVIGICYTEQIITEIPMEEHDVKLNCIITD